MLLKGQLAHDYHGVDADNGIYTIHFHPECWDYTGDWDQTDWETASPGDVKREEVLNALKS